MEKHISRTVIHVRLLTDANILLIDKHSVYIRFKLAAVLKLLVKNQNSIVLREDLIKKIWLDNKYANDNATTHTICKLRQILKEFVGEGISIKTLPKIGYCLKVNSELIKLDLVSSKNIDTVFI